MGPFAPRDAAGAGRPGTTCRGTACGRGGSSPPPPRRNPRGPGGPLRDEPAVEGVPILGARFVGPTGGVGQRAVAPGSAPGRPRRAPGRSPPRPVDARGPPPRRWRTRASPGRRRTGATTAPTWTFSGTRIIGAGLPRVESKSGLFIPGGAIAGPSAGTRGAEAPSAPIGRAGSPRSVGGIPPTFGPHKASKTRGKPAVFGARHGLVRWQSFDAARSAASTDQYFLESGSDLA